MGQTMTDFNKAAACSSNADEGHMASADLVNEREEHWSTAIMGQGLL